MEKHRKLSLNHYQIHTLSFALIVPKVYSRGTSILTRQLLAGVLPRESSFVEGTLICCLFSCLTSKVNS